jgi:hypothetical protein
MDQGQVKVETPSPYDIYNYKSHRNNPIFLIVTTIIILIYYIIFTYLGVGSGYSIQQKESPVITLIEIVMWGVFIFLLLVNGIQYFFDIDINAGIKNILSPVPEINIKVEENVGKDALPEIKIEKQVFHVPDSRYSYEDSKAVCKAYDADLATYDQIERAYKNKGEWCSYGWSEGQMVYYPTQKKTFDKLQKIPEHENDCGRPGINGGYIDNPNAKFGVNCYGYKPTITDEERKLMANSTYYPKTEKDLRFEKKVQEYRNNIKSILVSPFNKFRWSVI